MKRPSVVVLTAVLMLGGLVGCSEVEDAAKGAADEAACAVAQQAMDEVGDQAQRAIDEIGADPAAAKDELSALRDSLEALEGQVDGETGGKVTEARQALDRLVKQADRARRGTPVDQQAVDDAQRDLDAAVDDFTDIC